MMPFMTDGGRLAIAGSGCAMTSLLLPSEITEEERERAEGEIEAGGDEEPFMRWTGLLHLCNAWKGRQGVKGWQR